jgi:hypothetical protein
MTNNVLNKHGDDVRVDVQNVGHVGVECLDGEVRNDADGGDEIMREIKAGSWKLHLSPARSLHDALDSETTWPHLTCKFG